MKKLIKTFIVSAAVLGIFSIYESIAESILLNESLLLDHGVSDDVNSDNLERQYTIGQMPLLTNTSTDSIKELEPLNAEVLNAHTKNKYSYTHIDNEGRGTALHWATVLNSKTMVKFLLWKGTNVNAKNKNGNTPLHIAARSNSKNIGELLITNGADINAEDENGNTPLHIAAWNNSKNMGKLLITNGADINAKNNIGNTPLHFAVRNNSKDMGELLIGNGADINAKNNTGNRHSYLNIDIFVKNDI